MGEQNIVATLRADINGFRRDLNAAERSARDFGRIAGSGFDRANVAGRRLDRSTKDLTSSFRLLGGVIATLGLARFTREGFQLASQFISINRTLAATTGGLKEGAEALDFVRQTSQRLGTDIVSGARAFAQLSFAAQGTRLEGQGIRDVFTSVGEATLALGLSTDQYRRALIALTQITNRGRILTEELNQLAEAGIPIYKELAAALNVTGTELRKALEQGQVPAEALLLIAGELTKRFRETADVASKETPVAFQVLINTTKEATAEFFQAILRSQELNRFIRSLSESVRILGEAFPVERITEFTDSLTRITRTVLGLRGSLARLLQSIGTDIRSVFRTDIQNSIAGGIDAFEDFEDSFTGVGDSAKAVNIETARSFDDLAESIRESFNRLSPAALARQIRAEAEEPLDAIRRRVQGEMNATEEIIDARNQVIAIIEREGRIADEVNEDIIASIRRRLAAEQEAVEATQREFERVRRRAESEQEREVARAEELARRPIDQALNNIQDAFARTFSDLLSGELDSVQDFADSLQQILFDTFAEIAAARIVGPALENALGQTGLLGEGAAGAGAGGLTATGLIGAGALGTGAGFAASGILGQAGLGGTAGGALSGAIGGATTGALVGSVVPGIGTAIGAAAGALVGAIGGGLIAGLSGSPGGTSIALQTTGGRPRRTPSEGASLQGAFGVLSVIDDLSGRVNAQSVISLVAELDRSIFNLVSERQQGLIRAQLQFRGGTNVISGEGARETDEALNEIIVQRLRAVVTAVGGAGVANQVVGQGANADVNAIRQRVQDALGILRLIDEFNAGPRTEAAEAIRGINEEFRNLISRAQEFGIAIGDIAAEQARRIAEVANVVNRDVLQRTLALTDPDAALEAALAERQRTELENARDANADLVALERLFVLERQDLASQLAVVNDEIVEETRSTFDRVFDILRGSLGEEGQIVQIFQDFIEQRDQLSQLGAESRRLRDEFDRLLEAAVLLGGGGSGLISTFNLLNRRIREQASGDAQAIIDSLTSPFAVAQRVVRDQLEEFARLVADGILSPGIFNELERIATASAAANEALRRIGGGPGSAIEQVADAFSSFIEAGNPLSAAGQELFNLTENFLNLKDAADLLGLSTAELEGSFELQSRALRSRIQEDIDRQLIPRQQGIDSIEAFLNSLRTAEEQPIAARLEAAQSQFDQALAGNEVNQILSAAMTLREIARAQFGSAAGFFGVENQIESALGAFREQEQSNIDAERRRLLEQSEREQQQIFIGEQSLNTLIQVNSNSGETVRGIGDLIVIARQQSDQNSENRALLEQLLARMTT